MRRHRILQPGFILVHLAVTLSLLFSTRVAYNQMQLLLKSDPGYNTESILVADVAADTTLVSQLPALKASLLQLPFISHISMAGHYSTPTNDMGWDIYEIRHDGEDTWETLSYISVDENYFDLFNIKPEAGRFFNPTDGANGTNSVIVNKALVEAMQWKDPLAQHISSYKVVGVADNFNFYGLCRNAEPMLFKLNNEIPEKMLIKLNDVSQDNLLMLRKTWEQHTHGLAPQYSFLDQYFEKYLQRESTVEKILALFSLLSACLASLGLFGIINIRIEQTMKETGIRKIFGAGWWQLLFRSCAEYGLITIIAAGMAIPSAIFFLDRWLEGFASKTNVGITQASEALLLIILIVITALLYQAIKLFKINPLTCIKYE